MTWEWDDSDWTKRQPVHSPSARFAGAMAYDSARGRIVMFGGADANLTSFNETWEWDGTDWTQAQPPVSPPDNSITAMAYDEARGRVVVFGGVGNTGHYSDTWTYDGVTWRLESPTVHPSARTGHAMAYDRRRQRVLMFGGEDVANVLSDELWSWDGSDWTLLTPALRPPARQGHAMVYDSARDRIVIFGGAANGTPPYQQDTWEWDGTSWTQRTPATAPTRRSLLAATYDEARRNMVLCGGYKPLAIRDTWTYAPTAPAVVTPFGTGCTGALGAPALSAANATLPWTGSTLDLAIGNAPPAATSLALGTSSTSWQGLGLPLPLGSAGAPGCTVRVSFDIVVPAPGGTFPLSIPAVPALVGAAFYGQAVAVDASANALGLVFSNGLEAVIGSL